MVKLSEIINFLDLLAPPCFAEEWDNPGLLVGAKKAKINSAMLCLDVTDTVADEAIKNKCELIISHHPLIFKPIKSVTDEKLIKIIRAGVNVFAIHTNFDASPVGTNAALVKMLNLKVLEPLESFDFDQKKYLKIFKDMKLKAEFFSMGYICGSDCKTFDELVKSVKEKLKLSSLNTIKRTDKIKKIAVITGGASTPEYFDAALKKGADVIISGDLSYHNAMLAYEKNLSVIDATHFGTEVIFKGSLAKILSEKFDCNFLVSESEKNFWSLT